MKPIRPSYHASVRARERGASEQDVQQVVRSGVHEAARGARVQARCRVPYGGVSPVDGLRYNEKTIEAVFVEEPHEIVVVTVKVFYAGREE